jgi:hypothetical protein
MPSFKIPVTWEVYGIKKVQAKSIAEAVELIMDQAITGYPEIDGNVDGSLTVTDYDLTFVLNKDERADKY